jgi:hypothetical protein
MKKAVGWCLALCLCWGAIGFVYARPDLSIGATDIPGGSEDDPPAYYENSINMMCVTYDIANVPPIGGPGPTLYQWRIDWEIQVHEEGGWTTKFTKQSAYQNTSGANSVSSPYWTMPDNPGTGALEARAIPILRRTKYIPTEPYWDIESTSGSPFYFYITN